MDRFFLFALIPLLSFVYGQSEPYANHRLFESIRSAWIAGKAGALSDLLADRVKVNLVVGRPEGHDPEKRHDREKVLGILRWYFEQVEVLRFEYDAGKMAQSNEDAGDRNRLCGVAVYHYRVRETGIAYEKRIYFYLVRVRQDSEHWVISVIHES